ncbi:MAG: hypothetical protein ABSB83_02025 [Methanomassiliicoccales archaeon]|jgi:hypothetical protein
MAQRYRKKVTRSGKGAFSLYIPKRWIDGWKGEQARDRRVDLLQMDDHLIISPVQKGSSKSVRIDSDSVDEVKHFLLSCYVRGFESAEIMTKSRFTDEQICGARSFVRSLDDRLTLDISENRIAYGKNAAAMLSRPEAAQLQRLLLDKLLEGVRLMEELLEHFDRNPRRAIHLMQMLRLLEEDTDRLALQILRLASRMEISFENLVDLYYVILTTNTMENIGDSMFEMVRNVCMIYNLDPAKLPYPPDTITKEIGKPAVLDPLLDSLRQVFVADLKILGKHIETLRELMLSDQTEKVQTYLDDLTLFRDSLGEDLGKTIKNALTRGDGSAHERNLIHLIRIAYRIGDITTRLEESAKHLITLHLSHTLAD